MTKTTRRLGIFTVTTITGKSGFARYVVRRDDVRNNSWTYYDRTPSLHRGSCGNFRQMLADIGATFEQYDCARTI